MKKDDAKEIVTLLLVNDPKLKISISSRPFRLDVYDDGEPVFSLNSRQLLHIEHLREKPAPKA